MLILPHKSSAVWKKFLSEHNVLILKYITRTLSKSIVDGDTSAKLFRFEDTDEIASISKDNFISSLQEAKKVFVEEEEYEYAQKVNVAIDNFHINELLSSIQKNPPE